MSSNSNGEFASEVEPTASGLVATEHLREKIREYARQERSRLRADARDALRFGLGEITDQIRQLLALNENDVIGLASRIKRRKKASPEDMYRLSHAFLQSDENISTFNRIPGAIQVLIKSLTGLDAESQLSAAECLCNLSLGEAAVCEKIATLAGSYLVTYLHSNEAQMVRLCLWTLANILVNESKQKTNAGVCILQMQLLPQLWKFYVNDNVESGSSQDFREDAAVCLRIIAQEYCQLLSLSDREFVLQHAIEKKNNSVAGDHHLQIVFNILFTEEQCVKQFPENVVEYLIDFAVFQIYHIEIGGCQSFQSIVDRLKIVYAIRILANLMVCHSYIFMGALQKALNFQQSNISQFLLRLIQLHLNRSTVMEEEEFVWFIKNFHSLLSSQIGIDLQLDDSILQQITHLLQKT